MNGRNNGWVNQWEIDTHFLFTSHDRNTCCFQNTTSEKTQNNRQRPKYVLCTMECPGNYLIRWCNLQLVEHW
jgi:hypothetical protein